MSTNRSLIDQSAIFQHAFNDELGAIEVTIVGATLPEFKIDSLTQNAIIDTKAIETYLKAIAEKAPKELALQSKEVQVIYVDKVIVQEKMEFVQVPTYIEKIVEIIKEVEVIKEVAGPVKIEVITLDREVPVFITKTEYKDVPKLLVAVLMLPSLVQLILALLHK